MTKLRYVASSIGDLWRSSALIQGIMALTGFGTICYLEIVSHAPSQVLAGLVGSMIGFYFGTKISQKE